MGSTEPSFKRFVFILIDGAPYAIFKGLLENGDLPNIKKHVVDRGSLNKAVSVFPSTTGPAFIPFFMGLYPGTANIPGIRWLSKSNFHVHTVSTVPASAVIWELMGCVLKQTYP